MEALSRRNFVAGAATAGIAALAAKIQASHASEPATAVVAGGNVPEAWDVECEVLVIGAGGSGMMAAVEAARAGADVVILESLDNTASSSTTYCMGNYSACNTDEQAAAGIEDSPEKMYDDMMTWGAMEGNYPSERTLYNPELVRLFTENCEEAYRIIKGWGLEFPNVINSSGNSTNRTYVIDPRHLCQLLEEQCNEAGAKIMFETPFERLIVDGAGMVLGAYAADKDGNQLAVKATKATILATGAFMRNAEMMEEMLPGSSSVDIVSGLGAYGQGHKALEQLGGALWGRNNIYFVEGYDPEGSLVYSELCQFGAIVVNEQGDRYMDDGQYWGNQRSRDQVKQGLDPELGKYINYTVIDKKMYDAAMEQGNPLGLTEDKLPYLFEGETPEELGEKIGAPNLAATIAKYNEDLANGGDTLFHRQFLNGAGTGDPMPLDEPPYYAWKARPCILYSPCTGFIDNVDFEALDQFGDPIGGDRLYVLGELMLRSIEGNHYLVGSAVSSCMTFGMLCGRKVAELEPWA